MQCGLYRAMWAAWRLYDGCIQCRLFSSECCEVSAVRRSRLGARGCCTLLGCVCVCVGVAVAVWVRVWCGGVEWQHSGCVAAAAVQFTEETVGNNFKHVAAETHCFFSRTLLSFVSLGSVVCLSGLCLSNHC